MSVSEPGDACAEAANSCGVDSISEVESVTHSVLKAVIK